MSKETNLWLNTKVLVGYTEQRKNYIDALDPIESRNDAEGRAWHNNTALRERLGLEDNHYPGSIPVEDVLRRLFTWEAVEGDVTSTGMNANGVFTITDPERKTILRPPGALGPEDKGGIMGIFKQGYQGHSYEKWLLDNVAAILDDELGIGSAGLLVEGAQAFVMVEVPETIVTPEGVAFKPRLGAVTSFDGSLATTYKPSIGNWVCDNTMRAGLAEMGTVFRVKHTKNSGLRIKDAREALGIIHTVSDAFAAEVAELCATTVTDDQWTQFLDTLVPLKNDKGKDKTGAALTIRTNKIAVLDNLWRKDERVAPWTGSAWGVVQAVNTYTHHIETVRGKERAERNMTKTLYGEFDQLDADTFKTLEKVLA